MMKLFKNPFKSICRGSKSSKTKESETFSCSVDGVGATESVDTVLEEESPASQKPKVQNKIEAATVASTFMSPKELALNHASLARTKGLNAAPASVTPSEMKRRVSLVEEFMRLSNVGDYEALGSLCFEKGTELYFTDQDRQVDVKMPWQIWADEAKKIMTSFPDFHFTYTGLTTTQCGVVVVHAQASGTHTGAPYACGPCDAIDTTGIAVSNDPEEFCFFFQEGAEKCGRMVVCAKGDMTGPPGLYTQIGGFPAL